MGIYLGFHSQQLVGLLKEFPMLWHEDIGKLFSFPKVTTNFRYRGVSWTLEESPEYLVQSIVPTYQFSPLEVEIKKFTETEKDSFL